MYRLLGLSALILAGASAPAQAVEMFTNFHYGENVGFPPMQVPYGVYGGLGRGGWNPYAEGMPLKSMPDTPSMMPTGQVPGGFRRLNKGMAYKNSQAGRRADANANNPSAAHSAAANDHYDNDRSNVVSQPEQIESQPAIPPDQTSSRRPREALQEIAANPRRTRWFRGNGVAPDNANNPQSSGLKNLTDDPKLNPTPATPRTTVLHAGDAKPPTFDLEPEN
jgi:hypothetical protein